MNSIFKRALSLLLVFVMCVSMLPASALAEDAAETEEIIETTEIPLEESTESTAEEQTAEQADEPSPVNEDEPAEQEPESYSTEPLVLEETVEEEPAQLNASNATEVASGTYGNNLIWTLDNDGLLTISGTGPMTEYSYSGEVPWSSYQSSIYSVKIESGVTSIGGYAFYICTNLTSVEIGDSVTTIGEYAFSSCTSLTGIEIPDSVTGIGEHAFYNCDSLTSIEIPDSVTSIGDFAFYSCNSLTSIEIGNSVISIGQDAFEGCDSLLSIYVSIENSTYSSIDGVLFSKDKATLICCPGGKVGTYSIPDSVTSIGSYAFSYCSSLTSLDIDDNVAGIGDAAFIGCTSLLSINVSVENSTYSSIDGVLFSKDKATMICCPGGKVGIYSIPDSVTCIGHLAFSHCANLASVEIPDSVTSIGSYAFSYCSSLTSVDIGDSVTSIGRSAFCDCTNLTNVEIPGNVTSIGNYAFSFCSSLTSIEIPDSVTSIGSYAFSNCTSLTRVEIPSSVTGIGDFAFSQCSSLNEIVFEHSAEQVLTIGKSAFNVFVYYSYGSYLRTIATTIKVADTKNINTAISGYDWEGSHRDISYRYAETITITSQPISCTVEECGSVKLSVEAEYSGVGELGYLWKSYNKYTKQWEDANVFNTSYTNSTFTVNDVTTFINDYRFKCIISTPNGMCVETSEVTITVIDSTIVAYGTCGDNLTWTLDEDGLLTIRGTGNMTNISNNAPWYSNRSSIKSVKIEPRLFT